MYIEKVVSISISLPVTFFLANSLTVEAFGSLSLLFAVVAFITPLSSLGLNAILVKELVAAPNQTETILGTVIGFRLVGALLGASCCLAWGWLSTELTTSEGAALQCLAVASLFHGFHALEFWFQSKVNAAVVAKMRILVRIVFAALKVAIILVSHNLVYVAAIFALEQVVLGVAFVLLYFMQAKSRQFNFNFNYGVSILKQSSWLILSGLASIIYLKIDQIMLAHFAGRKVVGVYSLSVKITETWYFLATAVVVSVFPAILALKEKSDKDYNIRLQQISDLLFVIAISFALLVTFSAQPFFDYFFDQQYQQSATLLTIHIWASVFVFNRALTSKWLIAEEQLKFSLISHGAGAIVNLVGNYMFIPVYGAEGAAIVTLFSYMAGTYLIFWLFSETRPIAKIASRSMMLPLSVLNRFWRARH